MSMKMNLSMHVDIVLRGNGSHGKILTHRQRMNGLSVMGAEMLLRMAV